MRDVRFNFSHFLRGTAIFSLLSFSSCGFFSASTSDDSEPDRAPFVFFVTSPLDNGTYGVNQVIPIAVTFTEPVTVTGTPQLTLATGAGETVLDYVSGSTTNVLVFNYVVVAGDSSADLDYVSKESLTLNGGTIKGADDDNALLTLVEPGEERSLGASNDIVVDTLAPTVASVSASTANGTYGTSQTIAITVTFNEPVTVTGTPQLTLETGGTDAVVDYVSGSGTSTLVFNYTISAGQTSADLDYASTGALTLNSGTITDIIGNAADLGLPTPGAAESLADNKALVVDTSPPTITNVTSTTSNGTYRAGQTIAITVTFSEAVTVDGTPQLTLETGGTDAVVNYSSGTGTSTLTFNYTVGASETSADLDYASTGALALNGGTIVDAVNNAATLTLAAVGAAGSLSNNKALVIDTTPATVTNVTSTSSNGTYKIGDVIAVTVTFSEAVTVTGTPQLTLETGGTDAVVSYSSGSATNTLTFNYTVASGNASNDLEYESTGALALNSGTVRDGAGNDSTLTLPTLGQAGSLATNKAILVDGVVPAVSSVTSSTANASYTTGQAIAITVTFDDLVTVTGTPQLTLETGGTDAVVNYSGGTGTNTLTFNYTVGAGQNSTDLNYVSTSALALNSGTIRDSAGNDASIALPALAAAGSLATNKAIVVDTAAPTVTNVTSTKANGSYKAGEVISITVTFSEAVTVSGTPQLTLETGGTDAVVNYFSGSTSDTLTFLYTVAGGNNSADLDYVDSSSLSLNSGSIVDAVSIAAVLALPTAGASGSLGANKDLLIDTTAPVVSNVTSSTANGTYGIGQTLSIQVTMSEPVTVSGTPQLTLETGGTDAVLNLASSSGSTLTFTYVVTSGQESLDLDYESTGALAFNSSTIRDVAGNDSVLTLANMGAAGSLGSNKALVVDGIVPTVTNVTATNANATYGVGQSIAVTVTFSEAVNVTGSPRLILETGATNAVAAYSSGTGTNTLTFDYTVAVGEASSDLDYVDTSALEANGGAIRDLAANDGTLTLASPSFAGSLGANKAIVIATPATGLTIAGTESDARMGTSVANLGDINGDGKADYAVGEPYAAAGGSMRGRVIVRSGADDSTLYTLNGSEDGSAFGFSIAGAGDVNRDGRADFIVGQPLYDGSGTDRGRAIVYTGTSGTALYTVTGSENNAQLGFSVGMAGDINRDGKVDFIIGEPYANDTGTDRGKAYVYNGASGTVVLKTLKGTNDGGLFGYSVSGAGDVNRDGRADYIVGEPLAGNGGTERGLAYIFSGTNGAALQTLEGTEEDGARFGFSVAGLGDVNSDGKSDVVVGEPKANDTGSDRGKVFVYNGFTGAVIYTVTGIESNAQLGYAVAGAGDVNRDGRADFLVGEPYADNGGTDRGKVYVHSGATGSVLYTTAGTSSGSTFGNAVAGGGDFNRDGKSDFIVGAANSASGGADSGAAFRFTSGFTTLPALSPTLTYTATGAEDSAFLGSSVANLGDVNADGEDDFLIAEPRSGNDQGTVYVYSGASGAILYTKTGTGEASARFGFSAAGGGDVNGDGKNDFIVGEPYTAAGGKVWVFSGATGVELFSVESIEAGSELGYSVAIIGDADGDGKDDILISEPSADNGDTDRGIAYVISGGSNGGTTLFTIGGDITSDFLGDRVAAAGDTDGDGRADFLVATSNNDDGGSQAGRVVLYSGATGEPLKTILGAAAGDRLGFAIAPAGDVNADGEDDYIVASPSAASGGTSRGKVEVYSGSSGSVLHTISGALNNALLGHSVAGTGDLDGDGKTDFIVGAPYVDGAGSERGRVYVHNGNTGSVIYSFTGTEDFAHFGFSVGGGGDANRDGKADFIIGEPSAANTGTARGTGYYYLSPSE